MPNDLERDLRRLLGGAETGPDAATTARARAAALGAAPVVDAGAARRRGGRLVTTAVALSLIGLGSAAAVVLARTGALHDRLVGDHPRQLPHSQPSPAPELRVPPGTRAIAVSAGGRTWIATRAGVEASALPSRAVAASPLGNYLAVGLGDALVALSTSHTAHVWSHAEAGPVITATWAPDGLRIAYVAAGRNGPVVHIVYGSGRDDVAVAAGRPVPIAWRADALAIAYAGPGGHTVIDDFGHDRSTEVTPPAGCRALPVRALAFAPAFDRLAGIAADGAVFVVDQDHPGRDACLGGRVTAIAWVGTRLALAGDGAIRLIDPRTGAGRTWLPVKASVVAITTGPAPGQIAFATESAGSVTVWTATTGSGRPRPAGHVPAGAGSAVTLVWR